MFYVSNVGLNDIFLCKNGFIVMFSSQHTKLTSIFHFIYAKNEHKTISKHFLRLFRSFCVLNEQMTLKEMAIIVLIINY